MCKGTAAFVHACILATLSSAAFFIAEGVGCILAAHAIREAGASSAPRAAPERSVDVWANDSKRDAARAILARNVFDSGTGPLWPPPPAEAPVPPTAPPPVPSDERCEIEARIAASFYDRRAPARSWAALRGTLVGSSSLTVTRGTSVGGRLVADIKPEAVRLVDGTGRGCWLSMFTPQSRAEITRERAADAKDSRRARKRRRRADPPFSPQELQAGIRPLGTNRYAIRRHLIEKARANATSIAKTTRIVAARSGLRLARLRKGGLLAHLGLNRGDVVRSINGVAMSDVGKLLDAYAKLDRTNRIALAVTRGRERVMLEFYVQ